MILKMILNYVSYVKQIFIELYLKIMIFIHSNTIFASAISSKGFKQSIF